MEQETTHWLSTAPTSAQVWMDVSDPAVYLHTVYPVLKTVVLILQWVES